MSMTLHRTLGKPEAKTYPFDDKVNIYGLRPSRAPSLEIPMADFCELVLYALTNTDLRPDDPRLDLIEKIKSMKKIPGYQAEFGKPRNPHAVRLGWPHKEGRRF